MTLPDLWQNLPPEARSLLLGLAGKGAEGLARKTVSALGAAWRGTPEERALRKCLAVALAEFLACLNLPDDPEARRAWTVHLESLLKNDAVQEALARAVLHEGRPEAVDLAPFRRALDETTLPWREGQNLETAVQAFARAVEREAGAHPQLLPFLTAARLKRVADRLERGVPVEGMNTLQAARSAWPKGKPPSSPTWPGWATACGWRGALRIASSSPGTTTRWPWPTGAAWPASSAPSPTRTGR